MVDAVAVDDPLVVADATTPLATVAATVFPTWLAKPASFLGILPNLDLTLLVSFGTSFTCVLGFLAVEFEELFVDVEPWFELLLELSTKLCSPLSPALTEEFPKLLVSSPIGLDVLLLLPLPVLF